MSEYKYFYGNCEEGNADLFRLIREKPFDKARAEMILDSVPDLNEPVLEPGESNAITRFATTYLTEAVMENNLEAVAFLLEHGADPNTCHPGMHIESPLWELRTMYGVRGKDPMEEARIRYQIAKLFFAYGADPELETGGEPLFEHVAFQALFETFTRNFDEAENELVLNFFKLLIFYGGTAVKQHVIPMFCKAVDFSRIDDYHLVISRMKNGQPVSCELRDGKGKLTAIVYSP